MDSYETRDQGICEMWNDGATVDAIGRRYQMTNAGVYAVIRRRRDCGWKIRHRASDRCIHNRNVERFMEAKARAVTLEMLANDGRIDPFRSLSAKKASPIMGVHVSTLYRHAKRGNIPHERDGHVIKFRLVDLIEWEKSQ